MEASLHKESSAIDERALQWRLTGGCCDRGPVGPDRESRRGRRTSFKGSWPKPMRMGLAREGPKGPGARKSATDGRGMYGAPRRFMVDVVSAIALRRGRRSSAGAGDQIPFRDDEEASSDRQRHRLRARRRGLDPRRADARCAFRPAPIPLQARSSSTITPGAGGRNSSNCHSAASENPGHGREKGFEALYEGSRRSRTPTPYWQARQIDFFQGRERWRLWKARRAGDRRAVRVWARAIVRKVLDEGGAQSPSADINGGRSQRKFLIRVGDRAIADQPVDGVESNDQRLAARWGKSRAGAGFGHPRYFFVNKAGITHPSTAPGRCQAK